VNNVNDAPVIDDQSSLSIDEDNSITLTTSMLQVTDIDDTYPTGFTIIVSSGSNYTFTGTTITPDHDFSGILTVPVRVSDGNSENNLSDLFNVSITVNEINDKPVINSQNAVATNEDTPITLSLTDLVFDDVDNSNGDFTLLVSSGTHYTVSGTEIIPDQDYFGELTVPVQIDDNELENNLSDVFNLLVTVNSVNDAPVITGQQPLTTDEDQSLLITIDNIIATDVESTFPTGFTFTLFDGPNYSLSGKTVVPAADYFGELQVPVVVDDGETQNSSSNTYNLIITVNPVNDPPTITGQSSLTTPEDVPLTIGLGDLTVTDIDNTYPDDFTIEVLPGVNYAVTGGNTVNPVLNYSGTLTVPVSVDDGEAENSVSNTFNLALTVTPVNDPPEITGQQTITTLEDNDLEITLSDLVYNDPDNADPDDFTILLEDGANYSISGTTVVPASNYNGNLSVITRLKDNQAQNNTSNAFTLAITVNAVDDAPVIGNLLDKTINEGENFETFDLDDYLTEVDGDGVQWSYANNNELSVNISTGNLVTITIPNIDWNGSETIRFTVTDQTGNGLSDYKDVVYTVNPVDDPPHVQNPLADITVNEDDANSTIDLTSVFADIDNDNSSITKSVYSNGDPSIVNASISGNTLTLDYLENMNGITKIKILGISNGKTVLDSFNLTIHPVDDYPEIDLIPGQNIQEGASFTIFDLDDYLTEHDGDAVAWGYSDAYDLNVSINGNNQVEITSPGIDWYGTDTITFTVTDQTGNGYSDSRQVIFNIEAVDDAPHVENAIADLVANEDDSPDNIDLTNVFGDIDNDNSLITKGVFENSNPALINPVISGNSLTLNYIENAYGSATITIRGYSNGKFTDDVFEVNVDGIDDAPAMAKIPNQRINEGTVFENVDLNSYLTEVDGNNIEWLISGNHEITVNIDGANIATISPPDTNWYGQDTIVFTARDITANQLSASTSAIFIVDPVDDPPHVVNPIADVTVNEDAGSGLIDVSSVFADVDNDDNLITIERYKNTNPGLVAVTLAGENLTLDYQPNANGSADITLRAYSSGRYTDNTFTVTVNPVDDQPVLENVQDQTIAEGDVFADIDLASLLVEVDNDEIIWSYSGNVELSVNITTAGLATITQPNINWNGTETITFTATDNTGNAYNSSDDAIFKVNSEDDPPTIANPINDLTVDEDSETTTIDIGNVFDDVDNDNSQIIKLLTNNSNPSLLSANLASDTLTLDYLLNQNGSADISILAVSGGKNVTETFTVNVLPVDDHPVVSEIPDQRVQEGESFASFDLDDYLTEYDDDEINWNYSGNGDLNVNISTGQIVTITTPDENWFGNQVITFTAVDNTAYLLSDNTEVNFIADPVDDAPHVENPIADVTLLENAADYIIDLVNAFSDIDDDDNLIEKYVYSNSDSQLLSANISNDDLTLSLEPYMHGEATIIIQAVSNGKSTTDTFQVEVTAVDDPPEVVGIPDQTIDEGKNFGTIKLDDYLVEHDGDIVSWSFANNTELDITIDGTNIASIGIPNIDWYGEETVRFIATDQTTGSLQGYEDILLKVNPVDDGPEIKTPLADITVVEDASNTTVDLATTFTDIDNDDNEIQKSVYSNSNASLVTATITGNSLVLNYKDNMHGTATITIRAISNGKAVMDDFLITVTPVDDVPMVEGIPDQSVEEGDNFSSFDLDDYLTEVDGDDVTWSYSGNSELNVNLSGGNIVTVNTPDQDWFGSNTIRFTATDDTGVELSSFQDVLFNVNPVDDAPHVKSAITDVTVNEDAGNSVIDLTSVFSDIDDPNQGITKLLQSNTNPSLLTATISGNTLTLDYAENMNGSSNITIRALSNGKTVDDIFTVQVNPVNDPPSFDLSGNITVIEDFTTTEYVEVYPGAVPANEQSQDVVYSISPSSVAFANIGFNTNTGEVTITSILHQNGSQSFTITADDGQSSNNTWSETFILTVEPKESQTITFSEIPDKTFGDSPFALNATASSGLPVSYSIVEGDISISGNTVTISGAGSATIKATQAGNASYYPAPDISRTFTIDKAVQVINFPEIPDKIHGDAPFNVPVSATSGLPVNLSIISGPATLSGHTLTITGIGTVSIRAVQTGNENYLRAGDIIQDFDIKKADQTISFSPLPDKQVNESPITLSASASSGLPVDFEIVSGSASLSGNVLTFNDLGSITIKATQPGNTYYNAAMPVEQSFEVTDLKTQTIDFPMIPGKTYGDEDFPLNATASSGLPVSYEVVSGPVTIDSNIVTIVGTGNITIRATQDGNGEYNGAPAIERTFTISKANQTLTLFTIPDKTFSDPPVKITTYTSSGLDVNMEISSGPGSIVNDTLYFTGAGTITITVWQEGNENYLPTVPVSQDINVSRGYQEIVFGLPGGAVYGDGFVELNATASSGLPVIYNLDATEGAFISGDTLFFDAAGEFIVTATQGGNENYKAAEAVKDTLIVGKAIQTISFATIEDKTFGDAPFGLVGSSSAGLPVFFEITEGQITIFSDSLVEITGAGAATIKANQPGNANYQPASVTRSFMVHKANQTITFDEINDKWLFETPFELEATTSSGLPVNFEVLAGPAFVQNDSLYGTGEGEVTLQASQPGNENYTPASSIERNFVLTAAHVDGIVAEIVSPTGESVLPLGEPVPVKVYLKNAGTAGLSNFDVFYRINNGVVTSKEKVTTVIPPGDSILYTFKNNWIPEPMDHYQLCVNIEGIENDDNPGNDQVCMDLTVTSIQGHQLDPNLVTKLYPNPADDLLHLETNLDIGEFQLMIIDGSGKIVRQEEFYQVNGSGFYTLDIKQYPRGIYMVKIIQGNKFAIQRVVMY
jgi:hypothetical protein